MSETQVQPSGLPDSRQSAAEDEFVRLWGEMASQWGINRTMALIHALLFASSDPLDTDEIMERLGISRGNANMNLRALLDWELVRKTQKAGSRKDFYEAEQDVWKITTTIIEERQRREIAPVQRALADLATELRASGDDSQGDPAFADRIDGLVEVMEVFDGFTRALLPLLRGRRADEVQKIIRFAMRLRGSQTP